MKPVYIALCMEAGATSVIGRYEESQDAFDAMVNDIKEYIKYNVEDDNYTSQKFTPGMRLAVKCDDCPDFCVHIDKNGMGAQACIDPGTRIACEWRIERHDMVDIRQDVLDSKEKKEEQKMKPIYVVIYQELYELHLVGAYEDYQDAYNAMVQDVRAELIYGLPGDGHEEEEADKIMSEALASDDMLDDFKDYPDLAIKLNKDAGKAYLNVRRIESTWEIVQIAEVIKHQDNKEDNNNG